MDRRQWTAIALILMLGVAEGKRVQDQVGLRNALASMGRPGDVTRADIVQVATGLNSTCADIRSGWCIGTCPHMWAKIVYAQWSMKRMSRSLVSQQLGGSFGLSALKTVDAFSHRTVASTMVNSVWTFMQALDNSMVQRVIMSVWMLPGAAFRILLGIKPLGLCFFKDAWTEMQQHTSYRMRSKMWWGSVLAGCPQDSGSTSDSFEDIAATEKLLDGMVYAMSKQNDLTSERDEAENAAVWASAPTHSQCVLKLSRNGEWVKRLLLIEKGIISWTSTEDCGSSFIKTILAGLGPTKRFAMQFLTAPAGEEPVSLLESHKCIALQNPYRQFKFCATQESETMVRAKEVIDKQMTFMKHEHEILATTAELERLIAATMHDDPEAAAMSKDMDMTGDKSASHLAEMVGNTTTASGVSDEDLEAAKILAQVRHGSSFLQSGGNATHGHALLAEAYDQALGHEGLSTIMKGQTKAGRYASLAAGSAGTLTLTELIIILVVCSSLICSLVLYSYFSSNIEKSSKVEVMPHLLSHSNTTQSAHSPAK
mmetsp:Transcript_118093/g.252349  ORF Transcript_118093/g.252349 Transcript_118093/m.252349 type:complete len:540 (-) Transcript_118093:32-1651(-)|eukprot:CAMPEP_0180424786 /NCGR_PEP_ID=MMETSP1036_2-20121128/4918_1 /TAXON_ID=632150 /ORGANISM="Azadinium spinosum, Strain 3D9" /LENGTH=539 /DNA_ID=CAMNT_0022430237 /DNA_START=61 /DNA_END=1680 /DNA_ORIENTATION=-